MNNTRLAVPVKMIQDQYTKYIVYQIHWESRHSSPISGHVSFINNSTPIFKPDRHLSEIFIHSQTRYLQEKNLDKQIMWLCEQNWQWTQRCKNVWTTLQFCSSDCGLLQVTSMVTKLESMIVWLHSYNFPCEKQNTKKIQVHSQMNSGLEINLDVIPVIMTGGSLDLLVTAEFMPVIVTP